MKIDLHPLSGKVGDNLPFYLTKEEVSPRVRAGAPWIFEILGVEGNVENQGEDYYLTGTIRYSVSCTCDRCLKDILEEKEQDFSEDFSQTAESDLVIKNLHVDITPLVEDYLLLSFSPQWLCKEDCLGLCFQCGKDLNEGNCGCLDLAPYNPKFGKLAVLKQNMES